MATKDQYACFRHIYEAEGSRYKTFADRAALYVTIITLYFGLLAVAADKILPEIRTDVAATIAYLLSFAAFVVALTLVVLSMRIRIYVYPTDLENVLLSSDPEWPSDPEFYEDRMLELATAFKTNHAVNEERATVLKYASAALLAGIILQAIVLGILLFIL